jgi:hypothetical protein
MRLVCLKVVIVGVEFDKEAVGKDSHARDDAKDGVTDGFLDQEAVGNIGSIGEVKLETRFVDEGNLCSPDLCFILVCGTST